MAAYTRDTFVIYDKMFQSGVWERMDQNTNAFNGASNGAILLSSDTLQGDYERSTLFQAINEAAIARRVANSIGDATDYDIEQNELISVNLLRRIGPIKKTLESWYQIAQTPELLSLLVGQMIGDLKAKHMLNTAMIAVVAALKDQAALTHDATAESSKTLSLTHMNKGLAKLGDAFGRLACWVMHSKPYFDLVGAQIADKMDSVAGVVVYGGTPATMGKPVVVTDAPALWDLNASATDTYNVLGLVAGAVQVKEYNQTPVVSDVVLGLDNLVGMVQGEFAMNLGVKGCAWDTSTGGANPTDTALGTSGNWNQVATSDKDLAGFLIKVN